MKYDLTLAKVKNTRFSEFYDHFITGKQLQIDEYECILAIAVCFINAEDRYVQQFGYRIIVEYGNQTGDYAPLYEIAINNGLYPISKFIELHYIDYQRKNFFTEWNDAFVEQYAVGDMYQSEQQHSLVTFFDEKINDTVSIVAPTSYGKSELILSVVKEYAGKKICILTSTKALLMQTKKRIQYISKDFFPRIVMHPEMYNPNDTSCLAILTQERLLRVFKKDPHLAFDCIVVDEAHEVLEDDTRSRTLADVIIVAQKRNPYIAFKFLTPFLVDSENLKTRYTTYDIEAFKVSEYLKSEKYFLYDLRNKTGLMVYDQFLNKFISVHNDIYFDSEEDVVKEYSGDKNIIYLNKPIDIEKFALSLAGILPEVNSDLISTACKNISNYLRPQYNLLTCLRKGIIYHHGSVPDAIRIYIEYLYKTDKSIKYVISSSTLLSGVNLPAEKIFILDNRRGSSNLSYDSFRNLVGRVCRFSEIFNKDDGTLKRLEPQVYLVFGQFFARNANCRKYLSDVARVDKVFKDDVKNVLLAQTKIDTNNEDAFHEASEFIENYENGVIHDYQDRYTKTEIGKACIMNGLSEIDVFSYELSMQKQVDVYQTEKLKIDNSSQLLDIIYELFIKYLSESKEENLHRLANKEARNFYTMIFEWRTGNKSYSEMINLFVGYWRQLYQKNSNVMIFVGKWGDVKFHDSKVARYVLLKESSESRLVNLAIVRIKEEQDFIDNTLIKYVEILRDLELIEDKFYAKIKYGTDDEATICLIKNGLSLGSATLLIKKYRNYLQIDSFTSTVIYQDSLIKEMEKEKENRILIHEVQSCI